MLMMDTIVVPFRAALKNKTGMHKQGPKLSVDTS